MGWERMDAITTSGEDYLDRLEQFLMSDDAPPDCMQLSDLDGFLTGIAVGPELILPSEWLPVVWGGEGPVFTDQKQADEVISAIMRRYNDILATLSNGKWTVTPIYWETNDGVTIAADWAQGFLDAIILRIDAWQPLFEHRRDSVLLLPILSLCCDEDGKPYLPEEEMPGDAILDALPDMIPEAVSAIDDFWRHREVTPAPIKRAATPGRNDPCSCGSGKKFKRCCGA